MRRLLLATTNPDKVDEMRQALSGAPVALVSLAELSPLPEPEETGATFLENARLKATHYSTLTGLEALAEDSGLVIDALGGEPGVRSARFLRPDATYPERFAAIERRLAGTPPSSRTARFVCAAVVASGRDILFEATGTIEGLIAPAPAGSNGFGYDPIFFYPPYGATLAQVGREEKLRVSHRGEACRRVAAWLRERR